MSLIDILNMDQHSKIATPFVSLKRRHRGLAFTPQQLLVLEAAFSKHSHPSQPFCVELGKLIKRPPCSVRTWFQNRRAKFTKLKCSAANNSPLSQSSNCSSSSQSSSPSLSSSCSSSARSSSSQSSPFSPSNSPPPLSDSPSFSPPLAAEYSYKNSHTLPHFKTLFSEALSTVRPRTVRDPGGSAKNVLCDSSVGECSDLLFIEATQGSMQRIVDSTKQGGSPLSAAAACGHTAMVKFLLHNGADCNGQEEGISGLHLACCNGHHDVVEILLRYGTDVNGRSKWMRTALHVACAKGDVKMCELLIQHGAKIDALDGYNHEPAHYAVVAGHADVVHLLADYKAKLA